MTNFYVVFFSVSKKKKMMIDLKSCISKTNEHKRTSVVVQTTILRRADFLFYLFFFRWLKLAKMFRINIYFFVQLWMTTKRLEKNWVYCYCCLFIPILAYIDWCYISDDLADQTFIILIIINIITLSVWRLIRMNSLWWITKAQI